MRFRLPRVVPDALRSVEGSTGRWLRLHEAVDRAGWSHRHDAGDTQQRASLEREHVARLDRPRQSRNTNVVRVVVQDLRARRAHGDSHRKHYARVGRAEDAFRDTSCAENRLASEMERAADMERPSGLSVAERRQLEATLYQQGLTLERVAGIVGRNIATIHYDLRKVGVEPRKPGPAKGTPRPALRKHPAPTPRPCAHCGEIFTPAHATHVGKFCSRVCHNRANAEAQAHEKGEWRTCLRCGQTFWKYASQLRDPNARGNFCSNRCWGEYRWTPQSGGESVKPLIKANAARSHFGGPARRKHLGRLASLKEPGQGAPARGRPKNTVDRAQVFELRRLHPTWSPKMIAKEVGTSRDTVRRILNGTR